MKENARKFRLLSRLIDLSMFNSVTIDGDGIAFWGEFNGDVAYFLDSHRFRSHVSSSGKIVFSRSNLLIFLS